MVESQQQLQQGQTVSSYHAVCLDSFGGKLYVKEMPLPPLQSGEVLIRVEAAPINPADLMFVKGLYPNGRLAPCSPGLEGCGTVVRSGGGLAAWRVMGKRVAFMPTKRLPMGSWSEYAIANAAEVLPIPDNVNSEAAACAIINPLTALLLSDLAESKGAKGVLLSAGAGALGRMLNIIFLENGVTVINLVRKAADIELLQKQGAKHVLNTSDAGWENALAQLCRQYNVNFALDAVGGELTNKILAAMPDDSTCCVYGALSLQPCMIDPAQLIFRKKNIIGYWVEDEIKKKNFLSMALLMKRLTGTLDKQLKSHIARTFPLDQVNDAINYYSQNMTQGKVVIKPHLKVVEGGVGS